MAELELPTLLDISLTPLQKIQTASIQNTNHLEARIHKSWIDDYISYTKYQESPTLFHKWTAISLLSAALNRNVYIQFGYKRLYPNLYIILVSPTGMSSKTTAANMGVNGFLQKMDNVRILRDESTPKALIHFLSQGPAVTTGTRIEQQCSAYVYATELADCLGQQAYNRGMVTKLTALWDCPDIYDDTTKEKIVNKQPTRLYNVCLNFFACSNPEWLAESVKEDSFGGGFMGRGIYVFSKDTRRIPEAAWMEIPPEVQIMELTLLRDLQTISKLTGRFKVSPEAYTYYKELYLDYKGESSGRMVGYSQRKIKTYLQKLAMVMCINESNEMVLHKRHYDSALEYFEEVEKVMPEAFVYINTTNEAKIAQHILDAIIDNKGTIYRNELVRKFRHAIRNVREFDEILQTLIESNVIRGLRDNSNQGVVYVLYGIYQKQLEAQVKEQARMKEEAKAAEKGICEG